MKEIYSKYGLSEIEKEDENRIIVKDNMNNKILAYVYDNEEKIGWTYKQLMILKGKVRVPSIYYASDNLIKEFVSTNYIEGNYINTYESKDQNATKIGETLASLHIAEINEQKSIEGLKEIWKKYILDKIFKQGIASAKIFGKEIQEQILSYFSENSKFVSDFDLSMLCGKVSENSFKVDKNDNIYYMSVDEIMLGDACYDIALMYKFFNYDKDIKEKFILGYQEIINLPENYIEKIQLFILINVLDEIIIEYISKKQECNYENDPRVDIIKAILAGKMEI